MKIALCILSRNEGILHIRSALQTLGHEVCMLSLNSFETSCSYIEKKCDELGLHRMRRQFDESRFATYIETISAWHPERLLFVNLPDTVFSYEEMCRIREAAHAISCSLCVWMIDVCERREALLDFCRLFDTVASYERTDAAWISSHGVPARFVPVGYTDAYGRQGGLQEKEQDILFIGTPYRSRLRLLEDLAKGIQKQLVGVRLRVIGPFWERRYPWKKFLFRFRYRMLYPCVENRMVSPEEAAKCYAMSRICVNLHRVDARGCNPRTYEILAAGGFELVDKRDDYDILVPNQDLVAFENVTTMIEKIRYYLDHESERLAIAKNGQSKVREARSMPEMLRMVLR
ncbi:glycosyltransferase [Selenomonas noxia]|jgi:maturation of the outermost layer of the spore|uniref:glycosyltransferase family protein n=1 Tax=Selenomonas noxia TaxID=135083 RepID=UPI0028D53275|nr:glycosyltransferase [Selenomonas noxia]